MRGLSPTTVNHLPAALHTALAAAFRLGLVPRNVCDLVAHPRMRHQEMAVFLEEQARALLAAAAGDRLEALYVLAVTTGMREGELLVLRWRDVDLDGGRLFVWATLQRHKLNNESSAFVFAPPKTARSRRHIALSATTIASLRGHHVRQVEEREFLGPAWDDQDLVFANEVGRPIENQNLLTRSFQPLLDRAGLPAIRFHDLRHTEATLLLSRWVNPKIVSEMLGHASISITLDTYSHMLPHMQQAATSAMDAVLGG